MRIFLSIILSAMVWTSPSIAADECQNIYLNTVRECAKLPYRSTCVQTAIGAREACKKGPNQCILTCQATYESNVISCQQAYDPAVCSGNIACEAFYNQQRADCISQSVTILNSCSNACPQ
jgi:hypothetical protein